jgi:hypothetical protein
MVGRLGESLRYAALLRRFGILERDAAEYLVLFNWVKRALASRANAQEDDWVAA